jgi:ParB/RepB/Spo0J family partition protein
MSNKQSDLRNILVSQIRENPVALRQVNKDSEEYIGLRDSIRSSGIINAISVRERPGENNTTYFELVDGLHRFSAALDVGLETVPVNVVDFNESQVLEAQLMANVHKVETKYVEYAKQLRRILSHNPTMTVSELAAKLSKSPAWLSLRLGLTKLDESIGKMVDEDKINLSNAYVLSKLPVQEQVNFLDAAITMQPREFAPTVEARVKQLREATKQGKDAPKPVFVPVPFLQKLAILKGEYERPTVGPQLVSEYNITSPERAFALGVAWTLHLDPHSVKEQTAKEEARQKKIDDDRKARAAERAEKKAQEAAKAANQAREAMGVA